jgi:hypothetical protein
MTKDRAFEQAEIEFRADGKTRFVLQNLLDPQKYLITKWHTIRRGWKRAGQIDEHHAHSGLHKCVPEGFTEAQPAPHKENG